MQYTAIISPPNDPVRFHFTTTGPPSTTTTFLPTPKPDPFLKFKPASRFPSLKTKATVEDTVLITNKAEMSFYELLGISESGTLLEIKQAYKQLARKYHPDVSPPDRVHEYTQRFIQVQEAYETLSDPRRRAIYDKDMARGLHLAFSARRKYSNYEEVEVSSDWRNQWESQLSELEKRSMHKDSEENMSWAARMRRQREKMSQEV